MTKNWEGKVEEFIAEGRAYVAIAGNEVRRVIDLGAEKSSEIINQVKNYDYGSSVDQLKSQLGSVAEQVTTKSADFTVELGDKLGVYYQQALDATGKVLIIISNVMIRSVDQRALAAEKFAVVSAIVAEKGALIYEKAIEYEVNTYFEKSFEFVGRSVIWIGDAIGELAAGRTCCLKVLFAFFVFF